MMIGTIRRSAIAAAAAVALSGAASAAGALAHVEPTPVAVEAGMPATVSFAVEHGCEGSSTIEVAVQVPSGITDAAPVDQPGWSARVAGDVVTFSGGEFGADTPGEFAVSFTAPSEPGPIDFPVVQTCTTGEIAWIQIAVEGQAEPEHPAPRVLVTAGPPTSADLAAAAENDDGATDSGGTAGATSPVTVTVAADSTADDGTNTGAIVAIVAGVVVVGAAGYVINRRRRTS